MAHVWVVDSNCFIHIGSMAPEGFIDDLKNILNTESNNLHVTPGVHDEVRNVRFQRWNGKPNLLEEMSEILMTINVEEENRIEKTTDRNKSVVYDVERVGDYETESEEEDNEMNESDEEEESEKEMHNNEIDNENENENENENDGWNEVRTRSGRVIRPPERMNIDTMAVALTNAERNYLL